MLKRVEEVLIDDLGNKFWIFKSLLHREDGPAYEHVDGTKYWYINGKLHRENGPAYEYLNRYKAWWLNGKNLTEQQWLTKVLFNEVKIQKI